MEIIKDDLHKVEYRMWFNDREMNLVLDKYIIWERKTKRHGWEMKGLYDRLTARHADIPLEDVPFGPEVREAVKDWFVKMIEVKTWEERK